MSEDDKAQPPEFLVVPQVVSQYDLSDADQKAEEVPAATALHAKDVFYDDREVYGY